MFELHYKASMSKELQNIDCNCSDCGYLERSLSKRQKHVDFHYRMQKSHFDSKRIKLIESGEERLRKGQTDKAKLIFKEARKLSFVFNEGECSLHYGKCLKFDKQVSFISNTCQLDTQDCFIHRSELTANAG